MHIILLFRHSEIEIPDMRKKIPTELRFEANKILQLSVGIMNETHKYLIMPGHMFCVCIYMIISLFSSIRYYDELSILLYIEWPGFFVSMTTFVIVFDTLTALIYSQSVDWKIQMRKICVAPLFRKKLAAVRPSRCEIGDQFFYQSSTGFQFMNTVFNYAIALLIM